MKFTVIWVPEAEAALAAMWENRSTRAAVTAAANEIDRLLKTNPEEVGESRSSGQRIVLVSPLGATFEVREHDRLVVVTHVWQYATGQR